MFSEEIKVKTLKEDNITLRRILPQNAKELYEKIDNSREEFSKYLPWPKDCNSTEDVLYRLETWDMQAQMGNGACFGIFVTDKLKNKDFLVGAIFIGWIHIEHRSATISYWVFTEYNNNGYATLALKLLCSYCFNELKLNRLEISAWIQNKKSIAVAKKCGFLEEGISREYEYLNGEFLDHLRLSFLAKDYNVYQSKH